MMEHYVLFNCTVAIIGIVFAGWIAGRMRPGLTRGLVGLPLAFLGAIAISSVGILTVGASMQEGMLQRVVSDPAGAFAFIVESGIEFGLLAIGASTIGYIVLRMRKPAA